MRRLEAFDAIGVMIIVALLIVALIVGIQENKRYSSTTKITENKDDKKL